MTQKNETKSAVAPSGLNEGLELMTLLKDAVVAMVEDGWLYHGPEGMNEAQQKCYVAYIAIKPSNAKIEGQPD